MLGVKTAWEYAQKQATVVANSIQRLGYFDVFYKFFRWVDQQRSSHVHAVDFITLKVVKLLAKAEELTL